MVEQNPSLKDFHTLPKDFESWFWNWIFADAVYCGLGSVAFQGEMVAIAAELKKGSGTTACQGVPFDLICFKLKSSSQNQNWESFRSELYKIGVWRIAQWFVRELKQNGLICFKPFKIYIVFFLKSQHNSLSASWPKFSLFSRTKKLALL